MLFGLEIAQTRNFLADDSVRTRGVRWGLSLDMTGEDTKKTGGTFLIEKMPDPSAIWTRGDDHHTEWGGSPLTKARLVPHYFNDYLLARCLDQAAATGWVVARIRSRAAATTRRSSIQEAGCAVLAFHRQSTTTPTATASTRSRRRS